MGNPNGWNKTSFKLSVARRLNVNLNKCTITNTCVQNTQIVRMIVDIGVIGGRKTKIICVPIVMCHKMFCMMIVLILCDYPGVKKMREYFRAQFSKYAVQSETVRAN